MYCETQSGGIGPLLGKEVPHGYNTAAFLWLTVGAKVAIVSRGMSGSCIAVETTVVKLTKRDIVLANGDRFRHNNQVPVERDLAHGLGCYSRWVKGGSGTRTQSLRFVEDPIVLRVSKEVRKSVAAGRVSTAFDAWRRTPTFATAEDLRACIENWEALD